MCAKKVIVVLVSVLSVSALAWTEAETNSVVHELIRLYGHRIAVERQNWIKAGNVIDCGAVDGVMEELPRFERIAWPTAESLFGYSASTNVPGYGDWTPRDRHCAFWNLLSSLTNCNWSAAQQSEVQDAIGELEICRGLEFTNATSVARELAHSAKTPMPVRVTAVQMFFELSGDRQGRNALSACILTNGIAHTVGDGRDMNLLREGVYALQCDALNGDINLNHTNGVHESARMLYSNLEFPSRAIDLDSLLLKLYPMYIISSNRLAVAQKGLSAKRPTMQLVEYFSPITNLLMNAAQPLPEVDGL